MTDRLITERVAFRAAREFLVQFNQREKSESIDLLISCMEEETWANPLDTADPAQWYDWVDSVDRVQASDRQQRPRAPLDAENFAAVARAYRTMVDSTLQNLSPLVNTLTRLVATVQVLNHVEPTSSDSQPRLKRNPELDRLRRQSLHTRFCSDATGLYRLVLHPSLDGLNDEVPPVVGSIVDDLVEVYDDVSEGLRLFDAGNHEDATWEWRFSFENHWGAHAYSVLRVLHARPA